MALSASITSEASLKMPTFLEACVQCDDVVVKWYLQNGVSLEELNAQDRTGKTSLCHVCNNGYRSLAMKLQQVPGIDPNRSDNEGNTPLIFAAQAGHADIVSILLHGFPSLNVDHANNHGFTALMKSAVQGRPRCAKLLLMAGADPLRRDRGRGLCALEWAEYVGRQECAKTIAQFMLTSAADDGRLQDLTSSSSSSRLALSPRGWERSLSTKQSKEGRKLNLRKTMSGGEAYRASANSPLLNLDAIARIFTIPLVPELSPPSSPYRPRRATAGPRTMIIPKVEITMTSKDDNYFIEQPGALNAKAATKKKKRSASTERIFSIGGHHEAEQ
uniref:Uncharacterized protein n=1 Tax=Plectus sambesii TaxID=2011161 RepID=A0A914XF34_9BILA